jgi:L-arabinose isomerase
MAGGGNSNCRTRVTKPIHTPMDDWCLQGLSHRIAMALDDQAQQLEAVAEALGFQAYGCDP